MLCAELGRVLRLRRLPAPPASQIICSCREARVALPRRLPELPVGTNRGCSWKGPDEEGQQAGESWVTPARHRLETACKVPAPPLFREAPKSPAKVAGSVTAPQPAPGLSAPPTPDGASRGHGTVPRPAGRAGPGSSHPSLPAGSAGRAVFSSPSAFQVFPLPSSPFHSLSVGKRKKKKKKKKEPIKAAVLGRALPPAQFCEPYLAPALLETAPQGWGEKGTCFGWRDQPSVRGPSILRTLTARSASPGWDLRYEKSRGSGGVGGCLLVCTGSEPGVGGSAGCRGGGCHLCRRWLVPAKFFGAPQIGCRLAELPCACGSGAAGGPGGAAVLWGPPARCVAAGVGGTRGTAGPGLC
ncbi:translation initiation factor IF-2-like [Aquila chrysaetos chrysaetos]|uniref:translation initiation factor IF-2-like n=1 Tax=Aquila chrysaetos chrysaetos TaxID=223781 RepID=UPI00117683AC|nr:translation initiation factor IF-2-like [Aquila chrysaetos chrysaetos]